jgi:hypothetical protein
MTPRKFRHWWPPGSFVHGGRNGRIRLAPPRCSRARLTFSPLMHSRMCAASNARRHEVSGPWPRGSCRPRAARDPTVVDRVLALYDALVPDGRATKLEITGICQRFLCGREAKGIAFPFTRIVHNHFNFPRHDTFPDYLSSGPVLPVRHRRCLGPRCIEALHVGQRVPMSSGGRCSQTQGAVVHRTCGCGTLERSQRSDQNG